MATHKLLLLAGDGIGPEVMAEVKHIIAWLNKEKLASFECEEGLVGGSAYDAHKVAITEATMDLAQARSGTRSPTMFVPKPAFCVFARISACSPICARRCATRRWPRRRASSPMSSRVSTS